MTKEERKALQKQIEQEEPLREYLKEAKNGGFICPLCKSGTGTHGTGALFYYKRTNTAFCHACGQKISVFDVYMAEHGVSFTDAFEYFADKRGYDVTPRCDSQASNSHLFLMTPTSPDTISSKAKETEAEEPTANYFAYYSECEKRLEDRRALAYLASRGISLETAKRLHIGFDPKANPNKAPGGILRPDVKEADVIRNARIIAPCTGSYYETRSIKDLKKYSKMKSIGHVSLFNIKALRTKGPIFVTEGFFDCLSVEEMGFHGVAINGATNYRTLLKRPELSEYHGAFILCKEWDADEETRNKATGNFDKLEEALKEQGYKTLSVFLSNQYKDSNDFLIYDREGFRRRLDELAKEVCR